MSLNRREFVHVMGLAATAGLLPVKSAYSGNAEDIYDLPAFGNARFLHMTDSHAQLMPIYFREPNVNIGLGGNFGKAPHLVGQHLLKKFEIPANGRLAHAMTFLDYQQSASTYGKVGGFAHLATLVKKLRSQMGEGESLLLDGGDTWQGSGTAYWTRGQDMVEACNLLGVDIMTGHWEFTYTEEEVRANIEQFKGEFIAHNINLTEDALFDDAVSYDEDTGHAFKPYTMRKMGEHRVAVIGQAFPYTPIANPSRFIPNWTFGIKDGALQSLVNQIRDTEKPDAVIVISHNGMDVDLKMASVVTGIDVIFGGHTHDGVPAAIEVKNSSGMTLVTNAGSNGKFLGVMDLELGKGKVKGYRFKLLPVFSNLLPADPQMSAYIEKVRAPFLDKLNEKLAVADEVMYRRGNFNGTFDQLICDALRVQGDAQISLSPGFRWGTTVLSGQDITMEHVLDQTCITYPETYVREMSGSEVKLILEDVCDNLFNADPYYQQGGDMVRLGGLDYVCEPGAGMGKRISNMQLDNGEKIDPNKNYKVAGWATVGSKSPGRPIWDVVADHLRDQKVAKINKLNTPKLKGVDNNPGLMDYPV